MQHAKSRLKDIHLRDPFIVAAADEGLYYLYGTDGPSCWGKGVGFDVYWSRDLVEWEGPQRVFEPGNNFWADQNYWAPEVHRYRGRWYMLATFTASNPFRRGTQILVADSPRGPFTPHTDGPITPKGDHCLDGTLHIDGAGKPWLVYCHEWTQIGDGAITTVRLAEDLRKTEGEPRVLFRASSAPWARSFKRGEEGGNFVTDGPFLWEDERGGLLMLWSTIGARGYTMGVAHAAGGQVTGPWVQGEAVVETDGGHGMIFKDFTGRLRMTIHQPNKTPEERPVILEVKLREGRLQVEETVVEKDANSPSR